MRELVYIEARQLGGFCQIGTGSRCENDKDQREVYAVEHRRKTCDDSCQQSSSLWLCKGKRVNCVGARLIAVL